MERIIGTVREKERRPALAALLSLFFTGLGQWYCGEAYRAVVFLLLRLLPVVCIPFIPFSAPGGRVLHAVAVMAAASLAVWAGSSIDAYFLARRRSVAPGRSTSYPAYLLYAFVTLVLTVGALALAGASCRLYVHSGDSMEPLLRGGDIILVSRFVAGPPPPGSLVVYRGEGRESIARVAARPGDRAARSGSMLAVNGEFMLVGIYGDSESRSLGLENSPELFYEVNDGRKYPVRAETGSGRVAKYRGPSSGAGEGKVFVADDNRIDREWFRAVAVESITGNVEGVIWGGSWRRSMLAPFVKTANRDADMNRVNILD